MKKINIKYSPIYCIVVLLFSSAFLAVEKQSQVKDLPKRVLILGNSITIHGPKPSIGWNGNWGMAATTADKDFVHLFTAKLHKVNPAIKVDIKNIADFEKNYLSYNLSLLDSLLNTQPDLVILRLSENVDALKVEENKFEEHYGKLLDYLKSKSPKAQLISAASFWDRPAVTKAIAQAGQKRGVGFINLSALSLDSKNMALGQFENKGVAMHPSDQGMAAIAEALWAKLVERYPSLKN